MPLYRRLRVSGLGSSGFHLFGFRIWGFGGPQPVRVLTALLQYRHHHPLQRRFRGLRFRVHSLALNSGSMPYSLS